MLFEFGLIAPLYNLGKDLLKWLIAKVSPPDQVEIALLRTKWKDEFEKNLKWIDDQEGYGEAIIRDVKRINVYPETDAKSKGVSPWFRVGVLGTYHRGIEVGLSIESIKYVPECDAWMLTRDYDNRTRNGYVVGRIPFERIASVDWTGDEYYYKPNIYCRFTGKGGQPYEEVMVCEKQQGSGRPFYTKLTSYRDAKKLQHRIENSRG
jgi:hypothetical protein